VKDLKNLTILEPSCFFCLCVGEGSSGSSCFTAESTSDCVASKGSSEDRGSRLSLLGWRSSRGGGGIGALLDSPILNRVRATCALVGTPFRIVLFVRSC